MNVKWHLVSSELIPYSFMLTSGDWKYVHMKNKACGYFINIIKLDKCYLLKQLAT